MATPTPDALYRALVNSVRDYAIYALDRDGCVLTWNSGAERLKGYTAEEIIGRHFSIFYPPEEAAAGKPDHDLEMAARTGQHEEEGWRVRKDGTRFWGSLLITAMRDADGKLIGFAKVTRDLTARRQAQAREVELTAWAREEQELREMAQAAVHSRDEVLSVVSHDLRNPLGTVQMSASLLQDPEIQLTPEEQKRQLDIIQRSARRMNRLIQDLLDVARIEGGRLPLSCRREQPASLATEACDAFRPIAAEKSQVLECDLAPELPALCVDRDRVQQAIGNFLGNAIKFSPEDTRIRLEAFADDRGVCFAVSDSGPGIAANDLPRVFDRFWQAKKTAHMGSGLGLAIAKGIAEAHRGRVSVKSEAGRGSTFTLWLPADQHCPE